MRKNSKDAQGVILKHKCIKKRPAIAQDKKLPSKLVEVRKQAKVDHDNKIKIKVLITSIQVPLNKSSTLFKWIDVEVSTYPAKIAALPIEVISNGNFQEKLCWFREQIKRIQK